VGAAIADFGDDRGHRIHHMSRDAGPGGDRWNPDEDRDGYRDGFRDGFRDGDGRGGPVPVPCRCNLGGGTTPGAGVAPGPSASPGTPAPTASS
jgi:hypothetical protein